MSVDPLYNAERTQSNVHLPFLLFWESIPLCTFIDGQDGCVKINVGVLTTGTKDRTKDVSIGMQKNRMGGLQIVQVVCIIYSFNKTKSCGKKHNHSPK